MSTDVSKMSFADLQKLMQEAQNALAYKRSEEIKVLADGAAKKAQAAGFMVAELIAELQMYLPQKAARKQRATSESGVRVMYRDPADPQNTWSGRGRPARWLQAYIAQGRSKDEFKV